MLTKILIVNLKLILKIQVLLNFFFAIKPEIFYKEYLCNGHLSIDFFLINSLFYFYFLI